MPATPDPVYPVNPVKTPEITVLVAARLPFDAIDIRQGFSDRPKRFSVRRLVDGGDVSFNCLDITHFDQGGGDVQIGAGEAKSQIRYPYAQFTAALRSLGGRIFEGF